MTIALHGSARWLMLGPALALLAGSGCGLRQPAGATYATSPVIRGDIAENVTATGTLGAVVSVDVGSQVSGKIVALNADFNSPVKQGEVVAEIDPAVYRAALDQASGQLASAQADAVLKRQNLERKRFLLPLHAATQLDLDQAVAELAQAEATIVVQQAVRESAQANLGYCRIAAPVDGVVISRKVDLGQTVAAAMTTPVLFTIAEDLSKMNISASISEADIGQVHEGQPVEFTVEAYQDEVFHGKVAQVRKSPTTTSNVVTYETIISVGNPGLKLLPGMTADLSILVARHRKILKIPDSALRYTPSENTRFEGSPARKLDRSERLVYELAKDGIGLSPAVIKTGLTDGRDTEVVSGLDEDDRVVTADLATGGGSGFKGPPGPGDGSPGGRPGGSPGGAM